MLRGTHAISLDSKGRLAIPTRYREKFREEADGILVCTVDIFEPCLLLYALSEWEQIEKNSAYFLVWTLKSGGCNGYCLAMPANAN
nr:hypothetical protein [Oceanisphaera avium]